MFCHSTGRQEGATTVNDERGGRAVAGLVRPLRMLYASRS
jgi:hypothetical protein